MLQETLSYRISRFPTAPVETVITKTHPRSHGGLCMICSATTPHEGSTELVPLAPKKQRKNLRAMPCYRKLCKGCERASLADQLVCVLQGCQESGDTGERPQAQGHAWLPEESITSLPCTPASPNTYPWPQDSTSV